MKWWLLLASLLVTLITAWLVLRAGVALSTVVSLAAGAVSLLWLVVILVVPWNVCFAARRVVHEIQVSREVGVPVAGRRENEARSIARRMLVLAVALHVASAAVIAVLTYFSGVHIGYYFSGFYLLATGFRPAGAYVSHLRERVSTLGEEIRYPRADVLTLRSRVSKLEELANRLQQDVRDLEGELGSARNALELADHDLDRRVTLMVRRFSEKVDGLSDNAELITGLKAFLRLARSDLT
ncbi:hypothetical protein HII36_49580 [Nonomuraea sp. NN258]|uniref:hypothetical protein n=1 Tax=Nonomuraea antri TaxID=2730852 RepID=UPI001569AB11|nr:hypothetical protein [Nonomuraea antri]NRQ39829.1 hypothetical protein [Nonomuraea antri]